jgi:hypothetical protein
MAVPRPPDSTRASETAERVGAGDAVFSAPEMLAIDRPRTAAASPGARRGIEEALPCTVSNADAARLTP